MEAEIRQLTRKARGDDSDDEPAKKKTKKSYLEEEMSKYAKSRAIHKKGKDGKRKDEGDVLAALNSFRTKLKDIVPDVESDELPQGEPSTTNATEEAGAEPTMMVVLVQGARDRMLQMKDNGECTRK